MSLAGVIFAAALLVGASSLSSLSGQLLPSASGQQAAAQLPPGLRVTAVSLLDCATIDPPAIVATGAEAGAVTLVAPDRGDHAFDRWEDGSTNRTRAVVPAAGAPLTAYYLPVAGRSPSALTVNSVSIDGDTTASAVDTPVSVYRAGELAMGPATSPVDFAGVSGLTYSVVAHDLPGYVFARWENGSTDPSREVTLGEAAAGSGSTVMTAYYRPSELGEPARVLVKAVGSSGEPRYMWTVISSDSDNGPALRTGFAPMAFIGGVGKTYTVTVSDYQDRTFERWHDGDANRTRTFTVAGDTILTAHFRTAPYVPLSLNATTLAGEPLPGIYAAVGKALSFAANSNSTGGSSSESGPAVINATTAPAVVAEAAKNIVATGFSPMTFNGDVGAVYVVTPQDFGPYTFHHWEDGSTERSRIVPAYATRTITAHYDASGVFRVPVTLQTVDQAGAPLSNVYGIVTSGEEGAVKVGNSPMTYMAVAGRPYLVTPTSHEIFANGRYDFDRWEDGSTNIFRTVTVPPDGSVPAQTVTAYYRWRAASPTTVSVGAADISTGGPVAAHMDISPSGGTVVPGYLPRTFSLYSDTTYTLTPHDYGNYVFDRWEDGSTERVRAFVPPSSSAAGGGGGASPASSSLVAYYKTIKPSPPPLPPLPSAAAAGGTAAGSAAVALDILSPRAGQVMSSVSPTISGTAAAAAAGGNGSSIAGVGIDRVEVSIDCGPYARADGLERWSFGVPQFLSDGSHSATVRAVDSEGNVKIQNVIFAVNADPFLNRTGVYVPLFVYPAGKGLQEYDKLVEARQRHPSVPVITTINPASGPGEFIDDNFINATKKLQDGGVTVAGYVYAGYGPRDAGKIIADIDKYATWYGVDGVFIDEFANWSGYEDKFRQIADYARSRGMEVVVANAGWEVAESYLGTVDTIGVSEADGYVPPEMLRDCVYCPGGAWHYKHDKTNFWFVRYAIDPLDEGYVREVAKWVGLIYLTDGKSPVRWDHLPPYFDQLLAALDG